MIAASTFLAAAAARGFDFWCGVPCSFLTPLIDRTIADPGCRYVGATSEGEAVAIAAGAWLGGRRTVVMLQNSGLGNAVNPLTSLSYPFRIPALLIVTWRGGPGVEDEPQHELMGRITPRLLDVIGVAHAPFPKEEHQVARALAQADEHMRREQLPFALVMEHGDVAGEPLEASPRAARPRGVRHDAQARDAVPPSREAALHALLECIPPEALVIATTGKAGRELFTIADRPQHLYQVGSMGCASAMGLGLALETARPVVVVDGDGAALMKLGNLATIGAEAPANLVHLVLDNGVHDSTGGQPTVSASVDLAAAALACGYARGYAAGAIAGLREALAQAFAHDGPTLVHLRIAPGSMPGLGRPTVKPPEVARRLRALLGVQGDDPPLPAGGR